MNKRLIAYRSLLDIKQQELANICGISAPSYSKKETGIVNFTQSEMVKITKYLKNKIPDLTMDDIFFGDEVTKLVTAVS